MPLVFFKFFGDLFQFFINPFIDSYLASLFIPFYFFDSNHFYFRLRIAFI